MCLIISKFYHKEDNNHNVKCLVAKEDILVYKCLDCNDGEYCTSFQYMPIVFTRGKYVYNKVKMNESVVCREKDEFAYVYSGIHAYIAKDKAVEISKSFCYCCGTSMYYAVIPKGSNFYVGQSDDIVSNNLIVYREKRCFDGHYPSIIDFKQYIDKYLSIIDFKQYMDKYLKAE